MIKKLKRFIQQLFCKHEKEWYREAYSTFAPISGETRYLVCSKCGKHFGEYFA